MQGPNEQDPPPAVSYAKSFGCIHILLDNEPLCQIEEEEAGPGTLVPVEKPQVPDDYCSTCLSMAVNFSEEELREGRTEE